MASETISESREDRIITIILDGQSEARKAIAAQDARTRDLETGQARMSSAITNLLESFSHITKSFDAHTDAMATGLENQAKTMGAIHERISRLEERPALSPIEIERVRRDHDAADKLAAARRQSGFDLRVSLQAVAAGAIATLLVSIATAVITLVLIAPHLHATPILHP